MNISIKGEIIISINLQTASGRMLYESLSISKPANKAAQNEEERNMQMRKQTSSSQLANVLPQPTDKKEKDIRTNPIKEQNQQT